MSSRRTGWLKVAVQASLASLLILIAYTIYLDATLRHRFEGWRWDLPGELYARPLELYPGVKIVREDLERELRMLDYRFDGGTGRPGHVRSEPGRLTLHTRGFPFWDSEEPARIVTLVLRDGAITTLQDGSGAALGVVRLEPLLFERIHSAHPEDRELVGLSQVPELLRNALLAVEDRDFYTHSGFRIGAMARALLANLQAREVVQGGSTITQQLVKNMFLTSRRSVVRKLNELLMAVLLELHYTKAEILEAYLNEVYLAQDGNRAIHGFGLASDYFFAKPIDELDLHEMALLVAIVKGPSYYSPRRNPERARSRRNLVIDLLEQQELIDHVTSSRARAQPLGLREHGAADFHFPAYVDLVRRELGALYDQRELSTRGLRVFTSLDPILQTRAQQLLADGIGELNNGEESRADLQGAVVLTSIAGGEVVALVGGKENLRSGFNRALDAVRPIGSLVKPAIYLTALDEAEYTLADRISDAPVTVAPGPNQPPWSPRNFARKSHGDVMLIDALAHSYNQATVRLGMALGIDAVMASINRLGVARQQPQVPSVLLGTGEMSPLDVSSIYLTIASGGFRKPLGTIRAVVSNSGRLKSRFALKVEQAFDPGSIYLIDFALRAVMRFGTAAPAPGEESFPMLAGKTGTTDEYRDSWFAGYGGRLLGVVWLGHDDNRPTGLTGRTGALRVWRKLMAQEQLPVSRAPSNVTLLPVDPATGLQTAANCDSARFLPFKAGSEPEMGGGCGEEAGLFDRLRRILRHDKD